jgi:hypothetical protein
MRFRLPTRDDEPKEKQSAITIFLLACLALSPAAYVLSVGPFVWLFKHGYMTQATYIHLSLLYAPLTFLRDHFEPFKWLVDWYVSWFR